MNTIINADLVERINRLVEVWTIADQRCRNMFHGWEQRAMRAGLERGLYLQIGQLDRVDTECDSVEDIGRALYQSYRNGLVQTQFDLIHDHGADI